MPELPEIETICRYLKSKMLGKVISKVIIRKTQLRWPVSSELGNFVKNYTVQTIDRRSKYLLIGCYNQFSGDSGNIIIHLGMSGRLIITAKDTPLKLHDHVDFVLNDYILRYNDPRRFGAILWIKQDPCQHRLLSHLGLEPFDLQLNARYLLDKAKKSNASIKQFIMNHKIIVGVGNIYANEALFAANLDPRNLAKDLQLEHMEKLLRSIRKILNLAIKQGGTTLRDFLSPSGQIGKFVNTLKVYGKGRQACGVCGSMIERSMLGQRSTFYCSGCQEILE